uniref:CSON006821 protein n=1 Tax=Culicoides sonorensis TaxID=179676 RepID=A0A336LXB2_CULSO
MNRILNKLSCSSVNLILTRSYLTKKFDKFSTYLDIKPEIYDALHTNRKPLVALESTIITHGMPYPDNLKTAIEIEEIVRRQNAIPVTVAILDGKIKVGLSVEDLEKLAKNSTDNPCVKTSRRDFAYVIQNKLNGGTTVAGTLMVCNMVGLKIFATGGIGGVHRNFMTTMDVSADLVELGKSGVAVICSGVKSILDIPRTLEFLETEGVLVGSYQSENNDFPAFYTRKSGLKAPYNIKNEFEAAQILKIINDLELNSGMLIGVNIPEEFAMDEHLINEAINGALQDADKLGITGKEITPFILKRVTEVTKGDSLKSSKFVILHKFSYTFH